MAQSIRRFLLSYLAMASVWMLSACGGGGSGGSGGAAVSAGAPASTVGGTVAVGAPLVNATVTLKDANGTVVGPVTAAADGSYSGISVQGLTAPFRIRACGLLEGSPACFYSVVGQAGTANVTPMTDAGVALAMGSNSSALFDATSTAPSAAAVGAELDKLKTALQPVLTAVGVTGTIDFATTPFTADRTGLDKVLDAVKITTGLDGTSASQAKPFVQVEGRIGGGNVLVGTDGSVSGALGSDTGLQVDLRSISTIFSALSTAINTANATDCSTSMGAAGIFDPQFSLDIGTGPLTAASAPATICGFVVSQSLLGGSFANPVLKDCDFTGADKICTVSFDIVHGALTFDGAELAVVLRNGATAWKLLGRASPYEIHVNPAVQRTIAIDQPSKQPAYTRAISFDILSAVANSGTAIRAANVFQHDLAGTGWESTPLVALELTDACQTQGAVRLAIVNSSCGSTWLSLDTGNLAGPAGDALIDNFYKRGRAVRIDLYADLAKTQLLASLIRRIDGVPPKSPMLADFPWLELDSKTRTALIAYDGSTPTFTASWLPNPVVGAKDITFCLDPACNGANQAYHGDANGSPVNGGSATMTLQSTPAGALALKEIALFGRNRDGVGVSSNYISCGSSTACGI